jgi:protein-arginine kinase activator protein McsA
MNKQTRELLMLGGILLATIFIAKDNTQPEPPQESSQHLKRLQHKLNKAVENEDFEKACILRDKINSIQRA